MKKTINRGLVRFYLWTALGFFLLSTTGTAGHFPGEFHFVVLNNLWGIVYVTPLNFILFEYTVPFVFRKRKSAFHNIFWGILLLFVYLMLYSWGSYAWRELGSTLGIYAFLQTFSTIYEELEFQMTYSASSVFIFGISRHIYGFVKLKQATQQLHIEKQEAELNYLKSQTNPHFLFNTLNNIYSLSRDKSDMAPESILRLSKILRFMLYETGGDYISIEQEIKIINDYIELEKLRYDETLHVNFNYDIEDMKQALPPLLLIPLVENAFKHGVSETRIKPFVNIHLSVSKRILELVVKNSTESSSVEKQVKENIGLSNLRRQLDLLYMDYNLSLQHGESDFTAILKINLASHV